MTSPRRLPRRHVQPMHESISHLARLSFSSSHPYRDVFQSLVFTQTISTVELAQAVICSTRSQKRPKGPERLTAIIVQDPTSSPARLGCVFKTYSMGCGSCTVSTLGSTERVALAKFAALSASRARLQSYRGVPFNLNPKLIRVGLA
jgi:hypothetical protein